MTLTSDDLQKIADVVRSVLHPSVRLEPIAFQDQPRTPSPGLTAAVATPPLPSDGGHPIGSVPNTDALDKPISAPKRERVS